MNEIDTVRLYNLDFGCSAHKGLFSGSSLRHFPTAFRQCSGLLASDGERTPSRTVSSFGFGAVQNRRGAARLASTRVEGVSVLILASTK